MWSGGDAREKLFDWLMTDLFTRGTHSSEFQTGAALRLAYYFPRESEAVLVDRLDGLNLKVDPDVDGINPIKLFEALSFSPSIPIQMALLRVLQRTEHSYLRAACFHGSDGQAPPDPVSEKLRQIGELLPADGLGVTGDGYRYLRTVLEAEAGRAEALFQEFLGVGTMERKRTTCAFLQHVSNPPEWARGLLAPLLNDMAGTGAYYTQTRLELTPVGEIRVCDEAALALAHCDTGVSFRLEGTRDDLDRQIGEIRARLRAK